MLSLRNSLLLIVLLGMVGCASPPPVAQAPTASWSPTSPAPNWLNFKNPDLDESWTPPPPPTTPPELLEPDHEREQLAMARKEVG